MTVEADAMPRPPTESSTALPPSWAPIDWAAASIGPPERWPNALRGAVRMCLDAQPLPAAVWAGPELIVLCNDAYAALMGRAKAGDIAGHSASALWPQWCDELATELQGLMARAHPILHRDKPLLLSTGGAVSRPLYCSGCLLPVRDESGSVLAALHLVEDTSASVDQEAEREEAIATALKTARIGVWELDLTDMTARRSILHGSPDGDRRVPSWTFERFLERVASEERDQVRRHLTQAIEAGRHWSLECRMRRRDGQIRWIWAAGRCRGPQGRRSMIGVVQDVTELKVAQQALLGSEAKFSRAFHGSTAAMTITRLDDATILDVNERCRQMWGLTRDEMVGRSEIALGLWKDQSQRATFMERLKRDGAAEGEAELCRPDRTTWLGHVSSRTCILGDERIAVTSLLDVSQQREAEQALRASEAVARRRLAELDAVYEAASVGLCEFDDQLRWIRANAITAGMSGRTVADHIGKTPRELVPGLADQFETAMQTVIATRRRLDFEMRGVTPAEAGAERCWSEHWVPIFDDHERMVGVSVAAEELTEGQQDSPAAEEGFRVLADTIAPFAWMADGRGSIFWFNQRWHDFTGTTIDQARGWRWLRVVHPDHRRRVARSIRQAIGAGTDWEELFPVRSRSGGYRWFLCRGVPVRGEQGGVARWFGTDADVTGQRDAEQALEAANAQLHEADRRKNEFLAMLSHELRNPLAPIQHGLYILDRSEADSSRARHAREVISRQVAHLTHLVDDLLEVTRISRGKIRLSRERLDLCEVVRRAAEDHRSLFAARHVDLDVVAADRGVHALVDGARIAQVVGNLLTNAAKFTERGGRVVVAVEVDGGAASIRVRDTGVGIVPELLPKLFQPFVQADRTLDRSMGGLGLGLALVQGLVELHGGQVRAASRGPGTGAEFVVTLPLAAAAEATGGIALATAAKPAGEPLRVLVIEDNADAASTLREALAIAGHDARTASTGTEGLEIARQWRPDVVLCDLGLPDISGFEIARRMKTEPALRCVPLVALSGYAAAADVELAIRAGFARHLSKPADFATLERTLQEVRRPELAS